jgi:hypothetical protein
MIKYLRDSFKVLVGESDWLDDSTKNKSLEKLDAIIENNVYPDWILDNQELDKYYKLVNNFYIIYDILNSLFYNFIYLFRKKQRVDPKKAFEGILYLQMILSVNEFGEIHNRVNKTLRLRNENRFKNLLLIFGRFLKLVGQCLPRWSMQPMSQRKTLSVSFKNKSFK